MKENHQGLLVPLGNLRLWTKMSSRDKSHRITEKGAVEALKVRGQLVNAMACLGQHVPAKCLATIWTTSPPFCPVASLAKGQLVVWPAYSPEATAHRPGHVTRLSPS